MKILDLLREDSTVDTDIIVEMFEKFLPIAMKHIGLRTLPRMVYLKNIDNDDQPTFGKYENGEQTLYVTLSNRHPNDILRTVAHELVHFKQDLDDRLRPDSGDTGSDIENEANALAGVVMRHFNKTYPKYLSVKPVIFEKWSQKYKSSINCSNPRGFSQRAHCQGRKKNEGSDAASRLDKSLKRSGIDLAGGEKYYRDTSKRLRQQELEYKRQGILDVDKKDIHRMADQKQIKWDNDPEFLQMSKELTGVEHLDDMNQRQLRTVYNFLYDL